MAVHYTIQMPETVRIDGRARPGFHRCYWVLATLTIMLIGIGGTLLLMGDTCKCTHRKGRGLVEGVSASGPENAPGPSASSCSRITISVCSAISWSHSSWCISEVFWKRSGLRSLWRVLVDIANRLLAPVLGLWDVFSGMFWESSEDRPKQRSERATDIEYLEAGWVVIVGSGLAYHFSLLTSCFFIV